MDLQHRHDKLLAYMKDIANWRKEARAYDKDMGNPPRCWDEEEIKLIEATARLCLKAIRQK